MRRVPRNEGGRFKATVPATPGLGCGACSGVRVAALLTAWLDSEKTGLDMAVAPRRPLVAGNWKMNGLSASLTELDRIIQGSRELAALVDLMVCPPATLLARFAAAARGTPLGIGAQDCHAEPAGAFTGDLSAEMLKDAGATAVIVGHSERRIYHHETDPDVRAKALAAWRAGLCAIVCVGESRAEREDGRALAVVGSQCDGSVPDGATVENLVVAYEPVWAIGTGLTPNSGRRR